MRELVIAFMVATTLMVVVPAQTRRVASPAGASFTQIGGVNDPRTGFVNLGGPSPTAWTGSIPWNCRCMLRPEFGPPVDNAHILKSQGFNTQGINVCLADGSVRWISSSVTDPNWSAGETPTNGETLPLE